MFLEQIWLEKHRSTKSSQHRIGTHEQADIAYILGVCAPAIRTASEGRNWHNYAQRTARYAFGPEGTRMLGKTDRYCDQLFRLEGRYQPMKGQGWVFDAAR